MWWPEQPTPTEIQIHLWGFDRKKISGRKKKSLKLGSQMKKKYDSEMKNCCHHFFFFN